MMIDWVTVSAQIVNFLILVWLLKRFLYQPVLHAMDLREQKVMQRLKDAEQREQAATQLGKRYSHQQFELQQSRDQVLQAAHDQADKIKHKLLAQARNDVAKTRTTWQQQAELEKQHFLESLQEKVVGNALKIARKALDDLATVDLEAQVIAKFVENLQTLTPTEVDRLSKVAEPIRVTSSFALDESSQTQIIQIIQQMLKTETQPGFVTSFDGDFSSNKGWGIELDVGEQRLGWNIGGYLDDLGRQFDKALTSSR